MKYIVNSLIILFAFPSVAFSEALPASLAETYSSYAYVPLDPLPIKRVPGDSCNEKLESVPSGYKLVPMDLLKALPDQMVRMAISQVSASGEMSFTTVTVGAKSESYKIILDLMGTDTVSVRYYAKRIIVNNIPYKAGMFKKTDYVNTEYAVGEKVGVFQKIPSSYVTKYELLDVADGSTPPDGFEEISIPVYVGLGARLTASFYVKEGKVSLGLPAVAAAAAKGDVNGSLVVQTLGVSGSSIFANLPIPSELNPTTLQNALLSMGATKTMVYNKETDKTARVVGIYNAVGLNQDFVNAVISALSRKRPEWSFPCVLEPLPKS